MADSARLEPATLELLDFDAAVDAARPGNLFPSRVAWIASRQNPKLLRVVKAELGLDYRLRPVEIVRVPKQDRTTRPAADMPQRDQIVYAALVAALREEIPDEYVTFTGEGEDAVSYREFEEFPLGIEGTEYVLEADAAAFYQYVDHERLTRELVGLTGMAEMAEALVISLEGWMSAPRGLPQGPRPSQQLADIYIAPAARALSRAGFAVSRFSDDFRIPTADWPATRRAQQTLEEAFYSLGLAVAPGKLKTKRIENYQRWLERANDPRVTGAASRAALAEMETEEYFSGSWEPASVSTEEADAAIQVLNEQLAVLPVTVTRTRLVRRSLGLLSAARSRAALAETGRLLRLYGHLTPAICSYLKAMVQGQHESAGVAVILALLESDRPVTLWQTGWLLYTLSLASSPNNTAAEAARPRLFDDTLPWFARAAAALAVSVHGPMPALDEFFGVYERATDAARPDLVAAVVVGQPSWTSRFLSGLDTDPLLRDIASYDADSVRQWF